LNMGDRTQEEWLAHTQMLGYNWGKVLAVKFNNQLPSPYT